MKNKEYLIALLVLTVISAIILFTKIAFNDRPPRSFFTFNESIATYSIKKTSDLYWITYKNPERK